MDGRTSRWAEHNQAQRLRIVQAAIELYDEGRAQVSLHEISARAGVSRSVLYRHFADRGALDRAVQQHVLDDLWSLLAPTLTLTGTIRGSLHRAVSTYVDWAAAHQQLHRHTDLDMAADSPLQQALDYISAQVARRLIAWFAEAGAEVSPADAAATDPLAHGLVGAVFGTVRRWVHLGAQVPDAAHLTDLLVESVWALIDVRARGYGVVLDPERPITGPGSG
jgi:AcrR family transcriptional regulator